jgi:hypothetical protein
MKLFALILVFALVGCTHAWGPLTHFSVACSAYTGSTIDSTINCFEKRSAQVRGADLMDAFFFAPKFVEYGHCRQDLQKLHDGVFAGHVVKAAETQEQLDFALSFGSHVIADFAAFLTSYLSPLGDQVLWLNVWQHMLVLDARLASRWNEASGHSRTESAIRSVTEPVERGDAHFLANVTRSYHNVNAESPVASADEILKCSTEWSETIKPTSVEQMRRNEPDIASAMVFWDKDAQSSVVANQRFDAFRACAVKAVKHWQSLILNSTISAEDAFNAMPPYVVGNCPPNN